MPAGAAHVRSGVEESQLLLDLAEKMVHAKNLRELAEPFLGGLATLTGAPAAVLSLKKTPLPMETFFQVGLTLEAVPTVAGLCEERLRHLPPQAQAPPETLLLPPYPSRTSKLETSLPP